jgi:hypothetical protein
MRAATVQACMNDKRIQRQAAVIQDTIGRIDMNVFRRFLLICIEMVIMDMASTESGRLKWPLITLGEQHSHYVHKSVVGMG